MQQTAPPAPPQETEQDGDGDGPEVSDFDILSLHCRKPDREDNSVEINGDLDGTGGINIVMFSDSGLVHLDEAGEAELRNFLTRRQSRAIRKRRKERAMKIALACGEIKEPDERDYEDDLMSGLTDDL